MSLVRSCIRLRSQHVKMPGMALLRSVRYNSTDIPKKPVPATTTSETKPTQPIKETQPEAKKPAKLAQLISPATSTTTTTTAAAKSVNKPDSSLKTSSQQTKKSLFAEIYPIDKEKVTEEDLDKWIDAVRQLKNGKQNHETAEEIYLGQITQPEPYINRSFEPTIEQIEETYAYSNKEVPLKADPIVQNLVNVIMRHGKKALAQKTVSRALYIVQMKLRKDPIEVLKETLVNLGPLVKTRSISTGVAKRTIIPVALNERQRNRFAIGWILEASKKRKNNDFAVRLAEELINAYNGKSSGYEKRLQMHKAAMQQRANISIK